MGYVEERMPGWCQVVEGLKCQSEELELFLGLVSPKQTAKKWLSPDYGSHPSPDPLLNLVVFQLGSLTMTLGFLPSHTDPAVPLVSG